MAEIRLRGLVKAYPGQKAPAVERVSLDIPDGEFTVLLGPSGCGKTTLLRMVAGLELPTSGQVVIGDRDVTYLPPRERNLSMVFQSYAVFPHRKVRANIGFGLAMRGMPRDEIERKVAWAADLLQLGDFLDRYPAKLSGGQRQRVAVARAIVVDADVLLMDEPLSNLDALLRLGFRAELKKLVSELGTTTLYVTHDQVEALSLGDRVAVMRDGALQQVASPLEVYDTPTNEFVGGFIGSPPMNFLTGAVVNGHVDLGGPMLPTPPALASFAGRTVRLGVRAEAIGLVEESAPGAVPATVEVFEPLGSAVLLTTTVAGQQLKVQAPATFRVQPGETLWLNVPEQHQRWFDPETAMALETRDT
ncbi:MAG: ATP-binding cassette domain-containing protein [Micromonosporaceae bacterium]|nr:ATP-binding cassette domain-containing protein [Micromonosporaceae bacterium]